LTITSPPSHRISTTSIPSVPVTLSTSPSTSEETTAAAGLGQASTVETTKSRSAILRRMSLMVGATGQPAYRPFGQT
jgi:hypothetical protein